MSNLLFGKLVRFRENKNWRGVEMRHQKFESRWSMWQIWERCGQKVRLWNGTRKLKAFTVLCYEGTLKLAHLQCSHLLTEEVAEAYAQENQQSLRKHTVFLILICVKKVEDTITRFFSSFFTENICVYARWSSLILHSLQSWRAGSAGTTKLTLTKRCFSNTHRVSTDNEL